MNRRQFLSKAVVGTAGTHVAIACPLQAESGSDLAWNASTTPGEAPPHSNDSMIAVLAELVFPTVVSDQGEQLLVELATATRLEPGCRRYVVARDLVEAGHFHLSELWEDVAALARHFQTPHMARFSSAARPLGYAAPWMKLIVVASMQDLNPRRLTLTRPSKFTRNGAA